MRGHTGVYGLTIWLLAIALSSLAACVETAGIDIAPTPIATETRSATPIAPTTAAATTAPTTEPTPTPVANEFGDDVIPFGLIYQAADALWYVNAYGEPERILEPFKTSVYDGPTVSPNGAQVLYTEAGDIWLADITTGERDNLTQTIERFECCAQWWPGRSDVILFNSWTKENDGPNYGFPTVAQLDGSGYRVLDENQWSAALPAPSPDGRTVAYDRAGQPWLYRMDTGPKPFEFDLTPYNPQSDARLSIVSPAWSPDGTRMAWVIGGNFAALGGWRIGTGVFDVKTRTALLLHSYEPMGQGGWPPAPAWSPDGRWLVFTTWAQDNEESGVWVVRVDGLQEEEFHVGACSTPVWSPDGRWIACTSYPQGLGAGVWLIEASTWVLHLLDLPSDAYLVDWIIPPESWMTYTNNVHRFSLRHPPGFDAPSIDFAESRGYIGDQIVFSLGSRFGPIWRGDVSDSPDYRELLGWALAPDSGYEAVWQCDNGLPGLPPGSGQICYLQGPNAGIIMFHRLGGWSLLGE
jgi:hypothetical protein